MVGTVQISLSLKNGFIFPKTPRLQHFDELIAGAQPTYGFPACFIVEMWAEALEAHMYKPEQKVLI